ncbi:hypothetical protein IMCC3317_40410 [Kordia antarctica]|uniref:Chromosome partition protein Smc n=1 Tax=Kordia antarctica TaxID=1218801 RepID=A0A7L4ZQ96_9FLAO|nr:hypothetical protein [Kordia antarctica]QHI38647.1 hypothetical protein IMCC3317_40410 [Kordia antarctica]
MKKHLLILFFVAFLVSYSQNDNIPFAVKIFLKNDPEWKQQFLSPSLDYTKTDAIKNNADIINELYKPLDGAENIRVYNKRLKIITEGFADVLSNYKFASPFIAMGKEYLYQKAEESVEDRVRNEKNKFYNNIKSAFNSSVSKELKNNPELTYDEAVNNFSKQLESFSANLKPEDYRILAPIVDQQSLKFIKENRIFFEQRFKKQKDDIDNIITKTKNELSKEFDKKMIDFKKSVDDFDEKLLEGIKENVAGLDKFNQQVESKFQKLEKDVKEMRSDIKKNETQIASNKKKIEKHKEDIALVSKLQAKNDHLISDNSFKIGVITDVLYDNVNTSGKIKILDLKFKNDLNNTEYLKTKNTLENIQTIQNIQSYLSKAGDFVELASNLGLSPKDALNANKAIALGNVLINGTMAFYGNPMAGIQAINGVFALFGGGTEPDPQFDAIMAEFATINEKLEEMNKKLDVINENILDLRKLNVDLYIENQKRFTKIDEKLITIESKLNRITQLMYSDIVNLKIENIAENNHLWEGIRNANTLDELRNLYEQNQKVKDMVRIVFDNTENNSIINKTFLHFNSFDKSNTWENKIYEPMDNLIRQVYPSINNNNLEYSIVNLSDITAIPKLNIQYNRDNIFKRNLPEQLDILIYPQSILTLTEFTVLSEPYFYFYKNPDSDNYTIPLEISINTSNKNKNLKNKFENILIENRKAIAQTNVISGAILLPYFKKHILEKDFNLVHKKTIYDLITSQNEYLKLNLSNYLINTELTLPTQIEKFYAIQNEVDFDKAVNLIAEVNDDFNFENSFFKLAIDGDKLNFRPVIKIKPMNIEGLDITKNAVNLPIPTFEYIIEQKILYPEYLQGLLENQNVLINKIAKYDIIEKVKDRPEYQNYVNLN